MVAGALLAGAWRGLASAARAARLRGLALGAAILLMPLAASMRPRARCWRWPGLLAGALLVPMNALLQQRGASLLLPGLSVAVQNFLENGASIVFLAAYGARWCSDVPVRAIWPASACW